jgi:hypothetical protein
MKQCTQCKQEQSIDNFYPRKYKLLKGGYGTSLDSYCKKCRTKHTRQGWNKRVKEGDPSAVASNLLHSMRDRTKNKKYNEEVEWEHEDIKTIITNGTCVRTGIPFKLAAGTAEHRNPFGASPDRLDNTKGYTKDNVQWVVYIYNVMSNNFKEEDVTMFIKQLTRRSSASTEECNDLEEM